MAKLPKNLNKFCPHCNAYQEFHVKEASRGRSSSLSAIVRRKQRRGSIGNLGKFSKVPAKKAKNSKRPNLVITCNSCKKARNHPRRRAIKFQLV